MFNGAYMLGIGDGALETVLLVDSFYVGRNDGLDGTLDGTSITALHVGTLERALLDGALDGTLLDGTLNIARLNGTLNVGLDGTFSTALRVGTLKTALLDGTLDGTFDGGLLDGARLEGTLDDAVVRHRHRGGGWKFPVQPRLISNIHL